MTRLGSPSSAEEVSLGIVGASAIIAFPLPLPGIGLVLVLPFSFGAHAFAFPLAARLA